MEIVDLKVKGRMLNVLVQVRVRVRVRVILDFS